MRSKGDQVLSLHEKALQLKASRSARGAEVQRLREENSQLQAAVSALDADMKAAKVRGCCFLNGNLGANTTHELRNRDTYRHVVEAAARGASDRERSFDKCCMKEGFV